MRKLTYSLVQYDDLRALIDPIRVFGKSPRSVSFPAPMEIAQNDNITFCVQHGQKALDLISHSNAGIILCRDDIPDLEKTQFLNCIFTVPNPRLSFMCCLQRFFAPEKPVGIHPTAIIEDGVILPERVYIGPMVHLCPNVRIGEGSVIEDRAYISAETVIGKNVYIQVGAIIGCEGQGFERTDTGAFTKFPQLGVVIIGDDVEIGANTTIVRGALSVTRIAQGSKIGHHANIGHNVEIGAHVFISAGAIICGSAKVGDFSWLAPQCCIRNKVVIGKNVTVGLGSVVLKDVDDGLTVVGIPAKVLTA